MDYYRINRLNIDWGILFQCFNRLKYVTQLDYFSINNVWSLKTIPKTLDWIFNRLNQESTCKLKRNRFCTIQLCTEQRIFIVHTFIQTFISFFIIFKVVINKCKYLLYLARGDVYTVFINADWKCWTKNYWLRKNVEPIKFHVTLNFPTSL